MEKNTAWAIGLSSVVLIGFFFLQTFVMPKNAPVNTNSETAPVTSTVTNDSAAENTASEKAVKKIKAESVSAGGAEENFVVETNKVKVTFTNRGGDIISYQLKDHKDTYTHDFVNLAENISEKNRAFAIALGNDKAEIINDVFKSKVIDENTISFANEYKVTNKDGSKGTFTLVKTYTFTPDEYLFKLDVLIAPGENFQGINIDNSAYTLRTSPSMGPYFNPKNRYDKRQFISYNGKGKKKIYLATDKESEYEKSWKWCSMAGTYFEILTYPLSEGTMSDKVVYTTKGDAADKNNVQAKMTRKAIEDASETTDTYYIYAGPRNEKELRIYNVAEKNNWKLEGVRFDDSMDTSGVLSWIEVILKVLLENINKVVKNWGVSIIILTALLKFAMFPITAKTAKSTVKMQEMQPKMQAIQEKYKNNPQKLNEQTMKLYKEIGYNPLSGCLPMIFQFVILFAMFNLFKNYFEFRGASFIPGWIEDLSVGDHIGPTFSKSLPLLGWNTIRILPVIYLISQLLFGKITGNGGTTAGQNAGQMKLMMYGMPLMFFFLFYDAPSGLLLYWTVSNLIQLAQQLYINKKIKNRL